MMMTKLGLALIGIAALAAEARAQSGDVPCYFAPDAALTPLEQAGASGALAANGFVSVAGVMPYYETTYTIDVGVWVDDAFLAATPDAAALALRYFEHANCVFAAGANPITGAGVNEVSLRLAGSRIRYYNSMTPNAPGSTAPWGQQYHWDWWGFMSGLSGIPKVNIVFTTAIAGDPPGYGLVVGGGGSNGVGQGRAIIAVNPAWFADGMTWGGITRNLAEDWWGLIAAHELGHALGTGYHVQQYYNTMCCATTDYPGAQKGTTPSENFFVAQDVYDTWVDNDADTTDGYTDPYATTPNPLTNVTWSYAQISNFLFPRAGADVFVAPSTGTAFVQRVLRHDWFCINDEVCLTGDFDGDGTQDLVAFTRGTTADVYVSLSTGTGFNGSGVKWHDFFAINAETPLVGDFDGDGLDDIAAFTGGTAGDVYVALSTGHSFAGTGQKWHNLFATGGELPLVGDWNDDDKDDIAGFTRGTTGDVWVALSTGSAFGTRTKWHEFFCINGELPVAGDWDGDGDDDLATFTRGSTGDVYVALSNGASFVGTGQKWHEQFCINSELPFAADVGNDGKDDIVSFARGALGRVYVARSNGAAFVGTNQIWTTDLCLGDDVCGLADVTGDGRADALAFTR